MLECLEVIERIFSAAEEAGTAYIFGLIRGL